MEGSPHPEKALASARILEVAAPGAGHLVHMACHIYSQTGDYTGAVGADLAAMRADERYLRGINKNTLPYVFGYAQHNLLYLTRSAGMTGEYEVAYQAGLDLETEAQQHLDDAGEDGYLVPKILVLARFSRWDEILNLQRPSEESRGVMFFWHYARGCALAARRKVADAEKERDAMEATYSDIVPSQMFGMLFHDWSSEYNVADYALNARILAALGRSQKALASWKKAVAEQDQMEFHEPPGWYYPVRESLGSALLRSGLAKEAGKVFREDLERNPNNPRSLFGLAKSLAAQHDEAEANEMLRRFRAAWKGKEIPRIEDF
jgi:tetratricopeptide (TPR) repeat protein